MGSISAVPLALYAALAAVVALGSWIDVRRRRIPNWLCAANVALGLVYTGVAYEGPGAGWSALGLAAVHVIAALAVTMGLYAAGAIGAGDAKFYSSMAAWMPITGGLALLVSVAASGLGLLAIFFALRFPGRAHRDRARKTDFDKLPFGVAIGLGGLVAVVFQ